MTLWPYLPPNTLHSFLESAVLFALTRKVVGSHQCLRWSGGGFGSLEIQGSGDEHSTEDAQRSGDEVRWTGIYDCVGWRETLGKDLPHGISWSCGHTCGTHPPIYSFTMLVCRLHMKLWNPGSLQACLQLRPVPLWYQNIHTRRACSTSKDPEVKTRHPGSIMGALLGLETAAILRRVSWMPPSQQAHSYQLRAFDALAKWCVGKFFIWKMTFCEFLVITRSALQPKERNRGLSLRPVHSNTHLAHRWDIPYAATYWLHVVTGASGLGIRVFFSLSHPLFLGCISFQ